MILDLTTNPIGLLEMGERIKADFDTPQYIVQVSIGMECQQHINQRLSSVAE